MRDSQATRQGASVVMSERARIDGLLRRALDLERQLSDLGKSNEEKAAALRSHLCEVLSDIIISDPVAALEHDSTGKLWRHCFYAPIVVWRKKIGREQRKPGPALKSLEQNFKKFLGEALTLYEYLVIQYKSKLVPHQSQESVGENPTQSSSEGVVQGLFRLFIHMGDLHRYAGHAESFRKAETYYLNASKLAPGMGNPYNQLAVVSQLKDSNLSCVSLYWYCRSLLATHDSFETSTSNLERLFGLNRSYLREHSRDSHPPIFACGNKRASSDMQRAQKTAAIKACLAHLVDLHYEFFKHPVLESEAEETLRGQITAVLKSFDSLLQASAFGDSLLLKIVIICVFSVERNKSDRPNPGSHIAMEFTLNVAEILAEKVLDGVSKMREKSGKKPTSIRYLLPLHALLAYMCGQNFECDSTLSISFWEKLAPLATTLNNAYRPANAPARNKNIFQLKEFQILRGYAPYSFLDPSYVLEDPFVACDCAIEVLDLLPSQSQGSSKQLPTDDYSIRVSAFLGVCHSCSENRNIPFSFRNNEYVCEKPEGDCILRKADMSGLHPDENMVANDAMTSSDDGDDAGDLILNSGAAVSVGFDLLKHEKTPADHLAGTLCTKDPMKRVATPATCVNAQTISELGMSGLNPPPGFEGTNRTAMRPDYLSLPLYHNASANASTLDPRHSGNSVQPSETEASFFSGVLSTQMQAFPSVSNIDQSRGLFGSLCGTNNPFASSTEVSREGSLIGQDAGSIPGEDFLSSDLLESLWMDDALAHKTKNPFAQ